LLLDFAAAMSGAKLIVYKCLNYGALVLQQPFELPMAEAAVCCVDEACSSSATRSFSSTFVPDDVFRASAESVPAVAVTCSASAMADGRRALCQISDRRASMAPHSYALRSSTRR